jgi:formylglycine-generating enzyme required for sulfatase activity
MPVARLIGLLLVLTLLLLPALAEERKRSALLQPGKTFRDCPTCPEMIVIPAGSFMMGSPANEIDQWTEKEGPQHRVTIDRSFAVGKFEVTFGEWDACVAADGCKHEPDDQGWGRGKRPVINVSWDDVTKEYLPWLTKKTGKAYRLLTEAEWECAARAGTTSLFSTGNTITTNQANFDGDSPEYSTYGGSEKGERRRRTVKVGSFAANAFGLHDMHGNVWEWVQDCYVRGYDGAPTDGSARMSADCIGRVVRDGSWFHDPWRLRSAMRDGNSADRRFDVLGFRLARTLDP